MDFDAKALVASLTEEQRWALRQLLAALGRYYGDIGTIHATDTINIETFRGGVVSAWFRCTTLPFTEHEVDKIRADEMKASYSAYDPGPINGIEFGVRRG